MYILNLQIYFCGDHNTKNFVMKFFMPTDYIIDYIWIYFHFFLKLSNIVFNIFKIEGSLELKSKKHFPGLCSLS
jgi:hypothetical protein